MSDAMGDNESKDHARGRTRLSLGIVGFILIWMIFLPAVGRIKPIEQMIKRHHDAGIDPSIMFYTEIEHLEYRGGMLRPKSIMVRGEQLGQTDHQVLESEMPIRKPIDESFMQ